MTAEAATAHIQRHTRWEGEGLEPSQVPALLAQLAARITAAWEAEYQTSAGKPFGVENYRRVANSVAETALNAKTVALEWATGANPDQARMGNYILFHQALRAVLVGVNRVRRRHTGAPLDQQELLEIGLEEATKYIKRLKDGRARLDQMQTLVSHSVFNHGESLIARTLRVPRKWVVNGVYQKIAATDRTNLSLNQISALFDIKPTRQNLMALISLLGTEGKAEPITTIEEAEQVPDDTQDFVAEAEHASHTLLRAQVEGVLNSLSGRQREVLRWRFGLTDGKNRTLEEVGKQFNITRERVRQIEAAALRKIASRSTTRIAKLLQ